MDLLRTLPRLSWRGIEVPCTGRSVSFEHDGVVHKFSFRDKELVESQGIRNYRFRYTIPFREDITKAPYRALFTEVFQSFVLACRDRTSGPLVDPVLGQFDAKVLSFSDEAAMDRRDGVDVQVEFIESPPGQEVAVNVAPQVITAGDAKAIDAEIERVDWKQEPPPESTVDPLLAVDGLLRQVENVGSRVGASLEDFAFKLKRVETSLDRLADPATWPLRASVRRARHDAHSAIAGIKQTATGVVIDHLTLSRDMPLSVLAAELKTELRVLLAMNPGLSREPAVRAGSRVRYIRR